MGAQAGLPSCLDYLLTSSGSAQQPVATWVGALGDHAWLRVRIPAERQRSQYRAPTTWTPKFSEGTPCEDAANWATTLTPPEPPLSWEALFDVLHEVQHRSEDPERLSCKESRKRREPIEIKEARVALHATRTEAARKSAQVSLLTKIRQWLKRLRDRGYFNITKRGGTLHKGKKLTEIAAMTLPKNARTPHERRRQ